MFKTEDEVQMPYKPYREIKLKLYFGVMGLVNGLGFSVISSSAVDVSVTTQNENKMPLFSGVLVFVACLIYIFSSRFLLRLLHRTRLLMTVALLFLGAFIMILGVLFLQFYVCLLGAFFQGAGYIMGISMNLGFVKAFPPKIIVGFGVGSALAGVLGSGYYLFLKSVGRNVVFALLSLIPLYLIYVGTFFLILAEKKDINEEVGRASGLTPSQMVDTEEAEASVNMPLTGKNFIPLSIKVFDYSFYLAFAYFFQYCCIGFLAHTLTRERFDNNEDNTGFETIQFCYKIGVLFGRASIGAYKFRVIWVCMLVEMVFFLIFFTCALFFPTVDVFYLYASSVIIGFFGGTALINAMVLIMEDKNIEKKEKEVCVNLNGAYVQFGIIFNSVVGFVYEQIFIV